MTNRLPIWLDIKMYKEINKTKPSFVFLPFRTVPCGSIWES